MKAELSLPDQWFVPQSPPQLEDLSGYIITNWNVSETGAESAHSFSGVPATELGKPMSLHNPEVHPHRWKCMAMLEGFLPCFYLCFPRKTASSALP